MTEPEADADVEMVAGSRRPVDAQRVSGLLAGPLRWRVAWVAVTGSTNADLVAAAGSSESGQVLIAEEQLAGRGRAGRDWFCPPGAGLMFSALLRLPQVPADRRGWTGALLGLAIVRALDRAFADTRSADAGSGGADPGGADPGGADPHGGGRVDVSLKWPNDVLLNGDKCAGILGEVLGDAVVVGAGINVSLRRHELPRADATSLLLGGAGARSVDPPAGTPGAVAQEAAGDKKAGQRTAGREVDGQPSPAAGDLDTVLLPPWLDRPALLAAILDGFGDLLDRWVGAGGDVNGSGLRQEYRERCSTVGTRVRLLLPGGAPLLGRAVDVSADGALVVEGEAGRLTAYSAADVVHLRPGG